MAQPVFDEHPLGEYFRDAGDDQDIMPGSSGVLLQEVDTMRHLYQDPFLDDEEAEWRPQFLIQLTELLQDFVTHIPSSNSPRSPFVERFKYAVISSTLLGSSLSSGRIPRTPTPKLPGKLDHSPSPSVEYTEAIIPIPTTPPEPSYGGLSLTAVIVAALCSIGYPLLSLVLAAAAFLMYHMKLTTDTPKSDVTPSLETLNDLVAANSIWESVVQDAITTLENEERDNLYGPSSPSATSSSVRVALHSSLQTTQTQCDSVRELFSALTCPSELSQLSEMYAPPSPLQASFSSASRPLSLPSRRRASSMSANISPPSTNKRATWNGSYTTLAQAGSPTTQVYKRREKHRSNLSTILHSSAVSKSAPVTPSSPGPSQLNQVREDGDAEEDGDATFFSGDADTFGTAALELQRSRRESGLEALRSPPPSYLSTFESEDAPSLTQIPRSPRSPRASRPPSTMPSSSKFTALQSPRHPLSMSSIQYALQGALASKRYACSHLLALRFTELEDELYWENVRSVMSLLTTTLADASSRLADALDDAENQKIEDQVPTPVTDSDMLFSALQDEKLEDSEHKKKRKSQNRISFAPMPSHLSRFATHVASINSALDDARELLDECVSALKNSPSPFASPMRNNTGVPGALSEMEEEEHAALRAYERLRRELGVALRECERGRARLIEIIRPPEPVYEEEDSMDDVPGLGHDHSDDSDKPEPEEPVEPTTLTGSADISFSVASPSDGNDAVDDANPYLLLAASAEHLPPQGIEQVFEADTEAPVFTRERSKLSRDERIKLMKAKRESAARGLGAGSSDSSQSIPVRGEMERWGPGGEVVQELKDVIWKVGERRRKLKDGQLQNS